MILVLITMILSLGHDQNRKQLRLLVRSNLLAVNFSLRFMCAVLDFHANPVNYVPHALVLITVRNRQY